MLHTIRQEREAARRLLDILEYIHPTVDISCVSAVRDVQNGQPCDVDDVAGEAFFMTSYDTSRDKWQAPRQKVSYDQGLYEDSKNLAREASWKTLQKIPLFLDRGYSHFYAPEKV